jgi:predicted dehydrogenase
VEDGDLGEILVVQGTYSQDWLLYDTDWNWRLDSKFNGPSRCLADIGSHWCDMAEHITGQRITSVCADMATFHKTRKQPKARSRPSPARCFRPRITSKPPSIPRTSARWCSAWATARAAPSPPARSTPGARTVCNIEIYGTKSGVAWDQERPDELWIGNRNTNNQIIIKDPSLLKPAAALRRSAGRPQRRLRRHLQADLPPLLPVHRRPRLRPEYPQFVDGLRQLS